MRALITGGAGFIGSHLAEALLARGDSVHVVDDLSTGAMDNIVHLKPHPRFDYTIGSVTDPTPMWMHRWRSAGNPIRRVRLRRLNLPTACVRP